jgi:hypothetical protein
MRMPAAWLSTCWSVSGTVSDPVAASRAQVGVFVRELTSRPSRRGPNVLALDSGAGLSNATLQQRLVPVRLFYDFLMEEGLRESNPVGRGSYLLQRDRQFLFVIEEPALRYRPFGTAIQQDQAVRGTEALALVTQALTALDQEPGMGAIPGTTLVPGSSGNKA